MQNIGTVSIGTGRHEQSHLRYRRLARLHHPGRPAVRRRESVRPTARAQRRTIGKTAAASRRSARSASAPITPPAAWTGDWRLLRQRPSGNITTERVLGSTSGARLTIATDAAREVDNQVGGVGIASMVVNAFNLKAAGVSGSLGYRLPGGAAVMTAIVQQAVLSWNGVLPTAGIVPLTPLAGLELIFDHPATVNQHELYSLGAVVDIIGKFGPEDVTPPVYNPATGEVPTPSRPRRSSRWRGCTTRRIPTRLGRAKARRRSRPFAIVAGTYAGTARSRI
jgi:hypothetical protein